jgi:hypothetical protein
MRIPLAPAFTERPRFFHVQNPATRVAVGICRAISSTLPKLAEDASAAEAREEKLLPKKIS